jgi:hypothetical protein
MLGSEVNYRRSVRGQSVAEIAMILPILLLMMMMMMMMMLGALDLGRTFYFASAVNNACRVGAQYAFDPKTSPAEVKQAVLDEASPYLALDPNRITFTPSTGWVAGNDLTIRVTYDFHFLIPLAKSLWGDPIVMRYTSVIRHE